MPRANAKDSEAHAHSFINRQLKMLGWDIRNPERVDGGEVWTENECLSNPAIKASLGLERPEKIVKVSNDVLWVIEAKRSHQQLAQAISEAEEYARQFTGNERYQARFISGVAGNPVDSFLVRTRFYDGRNFVPITLNGVDTTGLLPKADLLTILQTGKPDIAEPEIDEQLFITRAEEINRILHLGAVNPHQRAGVMAALLLSMLGETQPNIDEPQPAVLIGDINNRVNGTLWQQRKQEFADYIRINLPSTTDNHVKLRQALVDTIQELNNLNIRSAMNSGADWLGAFYEVFLKYANWAQDLGIVLTPRHITRWVADVLDVGVNDIVYDPTCGTGGFLVSAFDHVKQNATTEQLARFKQHSVFGIEQDAGVSALAVVNMIFRGDGKNNIQEGDCFKKWLSVSVENGVKTAKYAAEPTDAPAVTKVMMNPPFALKRSDEKEFRFIEQALDQTEHGGMLFSVVPYSVMVKQGWYKTWRQEQLLAGNTLLGVVTLPPDLFYPVGVTTAGIFVRKGIPHPSSQNVLWIRALNDGLLKRKGKRLPNMRAEDDLSKVRDTVKAFLHNPSVPVETVDQFQRAAPIDRTDKALELVPEVYLTQRSPSGDDIANALKESVRLAVSYLVKIDRVPVTEPLSHLPPQPTLLPLRTPSWERFTAEEIFDIYRGDFHSLAELDPGDSVTISRVSDDNGFVGFYEQPGTAKVWPSGTITVSTVTGDTFVQPVPFIATDNVVMCVPKPWYSGFTPASLTFVAQMLHNVRWRYSYGRQCYMTKFAKTQFLLPVDDGGNIDYEYMEAALRQTPYWLVLESAFER